MSKYMIGHTHLHQSIWHFRFWLILAPTACTPILVKFCPPGFQRRVCDIFSTPYGLGSKCFSRPVPKATKCFDRSVPKAGLERVLPLQSLNPNKPRQTQKGSKPSGVIFVRPQGILGNVGPAWAILFMSNVDRKLKLKTSDTEKNPKN